MKKEKLGTLDVVLIIVVILFILFNIEMFYFYDKYQSIPEAYAIAIVTALIGECGITARIFNEKLRHKLDTNKEEEEDNNVG